MHPLPRNILLFHHRLRRVFQTGSLLAAKETQNRHPVQSSLINCIVQHQAGKLGTSYLKQYPLCSCFTNIDGSLCRGCIKIFYPFVNFCNNTPRNIKVFLKCAVIYTIMHILVYKSGKLLNNLYFEYRARFSANILDAL